MKRLIALGMVGLLAMATPVRAELTNTAANGFTSKHQTVLNGSAEDVWKATDCTFPLLES